MALQSSQYARPSAGFFDIVKSDATVLPNWIRGIYVGGAGDVHCKNASDVTVIFKAPPVGTVLPISPAKVLAATTATLLVALA